MFENTKFIDLTHTLTDTIPVWPGSLRFKKTLVSDYDQVARVYNFNLCESNGTHMDAPAHFIAGATTIAELPLNKLIVPAFVIDICEQVNNNPDYALNASDIERFEKVHDRISENSVVLAYTGWSTRWPDETR